MPKVDEAALKKKQALINGLDEEFNEWRSHYQALAKAILPRRYHWLTLNPTSAMQSATESVSGAGVTSENRGGQKTMNAQIYDSTGTESARTLAHGLMNGLTSPQLPWFNLRLSDFPDDIEGYPHEYLLWLDDSRNRMLTVMAESNFYGSLAMNYLDLVIFGISSMIIYDDFEDVIRCYPSPVGQFRFVTDDRQMVQSLARVFNMKIHQMETQFGLDNLSQQAKNLFNQGGSSLLQSRQIHHLIEPNRQDGPFAISPKFKYREIYWENGAEPGKVLKIQGFRDRPFMAPRWDVSGNDTYAHSPGMDALPDVLQLQHETLRKSQAMDKMVRPPLVADVALQTRPDSLLPGGVAWVPSSSQVGAKPIYTVTPPLGEMSNDIINIQTRIRRIFYNHLFRNISDLQTVRSATEVEYRKSEDMVILGAVLERMQNEGLDPAIRRIFNIMFRKEMFLPPPPGLDLDDIEIQYVSILASAQRAIGAASVERAYQAIGQLAGLSPEVLDIPDWDESVRSYFAMLGLPPKNIRSREAVAQSRQERQAMLEAQQAALVGNDLTKAAKNLSETEVGAGNTALDQLLGGQ